MATLSSLLSSIGPTNIGNIPTRLKIYHTSYTSVSNGGCCCLWTVPASPTITSITFELYGGGGGGSDSCCCAYESRGSNSGNWSYKQIDTVAGCQYRICAGGSTCCAYQNSNMGVEGYPSYVHDVTAGATIACACGGCGGSQQAGFTSPYSNYTCCWGPINRTSNDNNTISPNLITVAGTAGAGRRNTYCHTQYHQYVSRGFRGTGGRSSDLCSCWSQQGYHMYQLDSGKFPGGPGASGISCGDGRCPGVHGAGGQVIVIYN